MQIVDNSNKEILKVVIQKKDLKKIIELDLDLTGEIKQIYAANANLNLDDYIEICVENSSHEYNETAITTTSKPDTVNHGFGLKNISRVAKKYNGRLSITCSNNMFKTSVFVNYRKTG